MHARREITGVLVSGGVDSGILLHRLLRRGAAVFPIYLRCGLSWEAAELYWLRRFLRAVRSPRLDSLRVVDVPLRSTYGDHWSFTGRRVPEANSPDHAVFLPGRNVLLLSHAAVVCAHEGISRIALGLLAGNPFGDATPQFLARLEVCLTQALEHPIRVMAPLRHSTKSQLIRSCADAPLELTWSCLRSHRQLHCGRCNKCAERRRAFRAARRPDPTRYAA
ncbi:MAG: 7-cyano-7-deazaguanine synthase [Candidatus Omnitrophica bacterium]|nr:7-cyano-7-deazaguanine synthase [Candidatus Omnitrophota bacterium]